MKNKFFLPIVVGIVVFAMSCSKQDSNPSNLTTADNYIKAVDGKSFETNVKGISRKTFFLYNPSGTTNNYVIRVTHPKPTSLSIAPVGKITAGPETGGAYRRWWVKLPSCASWNGSSPAIVDVYYDSSAQPQVYYSFGSGCTN